MTNKKLINPIVIVANGRYPSHTYPIEILNKAKTIICTDGSANKLKNHGLQPSLVIGDMDSITNIKDFMESEFLHFPNQDNTDLEKVFDHCIKYGIKSVSLLGAVGTRDDHSLANLILLLKYYDRIKIKLITDNFTIECIKGKQTFSSIPQQTISLMAVYRVKSVTTKGLKFPLKRQSMIPSGMGVSNLAIGNQFTIKSTGKLLLFRSHSS
ncbi:MAG: thiamine diphosphokinase [Candidatus Marinimicrobia bacterium]|nr:thiamine diphosphokinase [Candidatus Neomarinimicrobiota bacterium]